MREMRRLLSILVFSSLIVVLAVCSVGAQSASYGGASGYGKTSQGYGVSSGYGQSAPGNYGTWLGYGPAVTSDNGIRKFVPAQTGGFVGTTMGSLSSNPYYVGYGISSSTSAHGGYGGAR